jgi:fatty-acyl-CoA synthase
VTADPDANPLSLVHGIALSEEPGLGALTIPGYLREIAERFGDSEALVYRTASGITRWSYKDLLARSLEVARALMAAGVGKDSRVGVMMTNRPEWLAAVFGTALAGGVSVPLNTFSTPPELEYLLQASAVSILLLEKSVAGKDFAATLTELEPLVAAAAPGQLRSSKFPFLRRLVALEGADSCIESWHDFLKAGDTIPPALVIAAAGTAKPADTGVIFFSSGTTSMPKGIVHSHRAVALQWWRQPHLFRTKGNVRFWTANAFFWSGNFTLAIGNALSSGGSLVLQSVFLPGEAIELLQMERVTFPLARPHQWARMESEPNFAGADFRHFIYVDRKKSLANHPTITSDWRMAQSFGATETLAINCSLREEDESEVDDRCYGSPLGGNTLKIVDPLTGVIVPRGERGELAIKGPTLMMGYLGKTPEECFDDEGYYRTGDGGHVDAKGRLYWEGRLSDVIKTGGANVSPSEIDLAIAAYPGVRITQTVGMPDDLLGEMVVSCVVPQDGHALDEAALRAFLKDRLASYKIPRRVLFFAAEEVQLTGSGAKIKAGALRDLAARKMGIALKSA